MFNKEFTTKLNKVFQLMSENRIRRDIDDTLLEKLLSFIKNPCIATEGIENKKNLEKLVQETDALQLIEKALNSAGGKTKELCESVEVFCIKMFGGILEIEELFISYKNSVLLESLFVICKYIDMLLLSTSINNALLAFSLCIAKHDEGAMWSLERNIPDFVFASFQSCSYYVRKSAVTYFALVLPMWSSRAVSMPDSKKCLINDFLKKILLKLIYSMDFEHQSQKMNITECCIMSLEKLLTTKDQQISSFHEVILLGMKSYLDNAAQTDAFHNQIVDLLIKLFALKPEIESVLIDIVKSLLKQLNFELAYQLAAEILRMSEKHHPISKNHLNFILLPFYTLTGEVPLETSDVVFHILPDAKVCDDLKCIIQDKQTCVNIIGNILHSLSSATHLMDLQALQTVLYCLNIDMCEQNIDEQSYHAVILQQRLVQFGIILLYKSIATEEVYMILNNDLIITLHKHLLFFLEKLFTYHHFICDALNLLKKVILLSSKNSFQLPGQLKEKLAQLLCKKLLDTRESIVESAVGLAAQIINADDSDWQENLFKYDIPAIVWDLAVEGSCDGTVKATAINAIIDMCMQPKYWDKISSIKGVSELDVENILLILSSDQDFLVQREALKSLFKWVKTKWNTGSSACRMKLFVVLTSAMKSLDLDLKIASLSAWQWLVENENYFPKLSDTNNIEEYLKFLSDSGFGSSLLIAVEDCDEPVQYAAADIVMKLRNKLLTLGITKSYKPIEHPVHTSNSVESVTCNVNPISEEEKAAGIDNVLNLTTAQQIGNITKIADNKKLYSYKDYDFRLTKSKDVACTVSALWTKIWSDSIDSITHSNKETDNNIIYAISLLDDIIAAEGQYLNTSESDMSDTPDCY